MADTRPWWPPGYARPAFQVRRQIYGTITGGDYVRGSGVLTLAHTALRYPRMSASGAALTGNVLFHVRPTDHSTVEIQWGWPLAPNDTWLEVSIVRSAFGRPSTVNDGQTIFRAEYEAFLDPVTGSFPLDPRTGGVLPPPIVLDMELPAGRWYHYGLFLKTTPVEWVRGMVDSCLLPRDLHHADHLWNNVPPYYQWVDDNLANRGYLKPFLEIFGFELDQCREFIESWQHLYDADWAPIKLLKHLGENFGVPYESGIGDIRYRSLMADIGHLYEVRGTEASLTELIANMSKYPIIVTGGASLMLTPDDSDFYLGIGNWAGLHPESTIASQPYPSSTTFPSLGLYPAPALLTPDHVKLAKAAADEVLPPKGRGAMRVWSSFADATTSLMVSVGDGLQYPDYNTIDLSKGVEKLPKSYGIPVEPLSVYGFTASVKATVAPLTVQAVLMWFDQAGEPYQMLSSVLSAPLGVADTNWHDVFIEGAAPANAVFMVPGLLFTNRAAGAGPTNSPYTYVAGAMAYFVGGSGTPLVIPPDRYLTMGDPGELIGPLDSAGHPTFQPFVLGAPTSAPVGGDTGVSNGTAIFPTFFRQQLFATPTLMNSVSVSVAYFAQHAAFTDPYDPRYVGVRTLADLQAKFGWGAPLSPTTTPQTLGTITSGNNTYVIANNPFVNGGGWTDVPVSAAAFYINGTVGGVVNPVIMITDTSFDGSVFRAADSLTAAPNAAISNNRYIFAWQTPGAGATQVLPVEGPLVQFKAPPNYEASHQEHAWLFPQRVNMIANPSFEGGINHWRTNGALSRIHPPRDPLAWEGHVTGTPLLVLESNTFPTHLPDRSGLWTIQLMVRGNGRIRVGLVSWELGFDETGVDWGPDTDLWTLSPDSYQHIYALRHVGESSTGLVRIECDGTEFFVDELLCEPEWLPGWPYFDGDTTYGMDGDYSWYGGALRHGQTFSLWYNHRRAVIGRLFSWSISDNDFTVTDTEIESQGFVYKWVPAGVRVIPHTDVLWIGDVQPVVPAVSGSVLAGKAWGSDALGVQSAWSSESPMLLPSNNVFPSPGLFPGSSFVYPWVPYPATTLFPSSTLFPD